MNIEDKFLESIDNRLILLDQKIDNLVSANRCDSFRSQCQQSNDSKFSDLYNKYNAIIAICTNIETTQKLQKPTNVKDELVLMAWSTFESLLRGNRFAQVIVIALLLNSVDIFTNIAIQLYQLIISRSF
jgi:hypothetical protein